MSTSNCKKILFSASNYNINASCKNNHPMIVEKNDAPEIFLRFYLSFEWAHSNSKICSHLIVIQQFFFLCSNTTIWGGVGTKKSYTYLLHFIQKIENLTFQKLR